MREGIPRWGRLLMGGAVTLLLTAGAFAAGANFAKPWWKGVILGVVSAAAGLAGTMLWDRHTTRAAWWRAWRSVTSSGPVRVERGDPVPGDGSLLAALNPDQEIVAFSSLRDRDLRSLQRWCAIPGPQRLWLISGPAGYGKTRLLIEATTRLTPDWTIGWVRESAVNAANLAVASSRPVLLVVDDADTRIDLAAMLTAVRDSDTVRIIAAARDPLGWWLRMRGSLPRDVDAALPPVPQTVMASLTPNAAEQRQRFTGAVKAFARHWDSSAPAANLIPPDPPAPLVLIHAAAAVAVYDDLTGPVDLDDILERLFTIEEAWWQHNADDAGLPEVGVAVLRSVVIAGAMLGAADDADAIRTLRYLPGLTSAGDSLLQQLTLWLRQLYPAKAGGWLNPHLPGRLVEYYLARQLATHPPLLTAIAAATTADQLETTSVESAGRAVRVLTIIGAAAHHTPAAEQVVYGLLCANPRLLPAALIVAHDAPIDRAVAATIVAINLDIERVDILENLLPATTTTHTLLHTAVAVSRAGLAFATTDDQRARRQHNLGVRLVEAGEREEALAALDEAVTIRRRLAASNPAAHDPDLAGSLTSLGICLSGAGRGEEALAAVDEAVTIRRRLAASNPAAHDPDLAGSLTSLGICLSGAGRGEEALAAVDEAVTIRRRLAASNPAAHDADLAQSLNNLGYYLSALGRREKALTAVDQAAAIYRRLAASNPAAYDSNLALSLNNLGYYLSALGRREKALTAVDEAAAIYRRLAASNPAAYDPDLALSLTNLGNRLSELGRHEEALTAAGEAVTIYRRLAVVNPAAFNSGLAGSLTSLGSHLSELGRHEEALAATVEAVTTCRRLAASNPAANEPNLAGSLTNLGAILSQLGRREEALAAAGEAVTIYRRLAAVNPAACDADLAPSLTNLDLCLSDLGRRKEALTAAEEAVTVYRRVVSQHPGVFVAELAAAVDRQRQHQATLGLSDK